MGRHWFEPHWQRRDKAHSSTNRAKSHVRGKKPKTAAPAVDAFACNEVRLLIAMLAYQIMHVARRAVARATGTAWSLRRLRERVLRGGARRLVEPEHLSQAVDHPADDLLWLRLGLCRAVYRLAAVLFALAVTGGLIASLLIRGPSSRSDPLHSSCDGSHMSASEPGV